ncbi:hypothetical protein QQ045_007842 [Rhodiola kirilowii]
MPDSSLSPQKNGSKNITTEYRVGPQIINPKPPTVTNGTHGAGPLPLIVTPTPRLTGVQQNINRGIKDKEMY